MNSQSVVKQALSYVQTFVCFLMIKRSFRSPIKYLHFLLNRHLCHPVRDIRRRRPPVGTTDVVAAGIGSHLLRLGSLVTGETTYEIVCQIIHHTYDQHRLCA